MRVLIFTQYFTPEIGATQTRVHTFAAGLAARGHDVEVVCEVPNHPQGIIRPEFRGHAVRRRQLDGFRATYVWVYTSSQKTTRRRVAFYGSYMTMASIVGSAVRRPDVVFASSPPLPVALAAAVVAARYRVPWVMDVRDLWPEAAVALGELSNPRLLRLAERLERSLYASANMITAVTDPFCKKIATRTHDPDKVVLLPNGTTRFWVDGADLRVDRGSLELPTDRFLWTFAGNIGAAQGLEAAIDAAGLLGDRFRLLILGDGPARNQLEQRASSLPPGRVEFRDQVRQDVARRYLRASDCLLVPLAADPTLATFVPSKLYDCCAVGRPVIVAAAGEPHRLAESARAALAVPPGDAPALADAVRRLASDPGLHERLGAAGRAFGRENLRDHQVDQLGGLLEELVADFARGRRG
jgi:putative colanic acid biosynthesis glycosyltransferase WcaI